MKVVAAVFADFAESFLGGPSQLLTDLAGQTILARTLRRLMRLAAVNARCLVVRPRDRVIAEQTVQASGLAGEIDLLDLDDGQRPRRGLVRSARKWNLDAWRGSPLGTTWFDEFVEPLCVARVAQHYGSESVLCLEGHMPLLDQEIAATMLTQQKEFELEGKLVFTQAPPGLAGVVLRCDLIRELLEQDCPLGLLLSYRPESPHLDPINQPVCTAIDAQVAQTAARLTGDTRRSRELLSAALTELGENVGSAGLCAWLRRAGHDRAGPLPVEIELELTTDDPLPDTALRPRGQRVPYRRLGDLPAVERLTRQLAEYDDRLLVLGGHGDPLSHPSFVAVCALVRSAGTCGLAVSTPLVELSDENLDAMVTSQVDVLQVRLDANSPDTYLLVQKADMFATVVGNIERVERLRRLRLCPQPLIVPSLTRCAATRPELEVFYDRWIRATGWALIEGYSDYCGMLPPDSLLPTQPPIRGPCRRLSSRLMLLANGAAVICSQDFAGAYEIGNWYSEPISDIWSGVRLGRVRAAHGAMEFGPGLPCGPCHEWFRP